MVNQGVAFLFLLFPLLSIRRWLIDSPIVFVVEKQRFVGSSTKFRLTVGNRQKLKKLRYETDAPFSYWVNHLIEKADAQALILDYFDGKIRCRA